MSDDYQEKVYRQIKSFVDRQGWEYSETEEKDTKRLDIRSGRHKAVAKIYTTGTCQIQGARSKVKEALEKLKKAIEGDEIASEDILPFEIEQFPDTLQTNIPSIDPIIVRFLSEAILCYKANSLLGCSFLLGAASEKAILLLIESYVQSIQDEKNRERLRARVGNKFISRAYEEFAQSFRSCKTKPSDPVLMQDLETKIESIFQFCRICRNESGHPQISPNLDKGVLLANMGQFVKYMEAIYRLIDYFKNTKTIV